MILVTGGTGLLGAHLLYDLTVAGNRVRALKRPSSSLQNVKKTFAYYSSDSEKLLSQIEWVDGDLTDVYSLLDALTDITHVYHCAAMVSFNPADRHKLHTANVEGTANLVNAAIEKKVQRFCYVSSVAAVGRAKDLITEETYWKSYSGVSNYSVSKYLAEQEVWRGAEEGLNMVIVNPGFILGPGNWNSATSSNTFNTVYKGLKFYTEGMTGFVDVRDVTCVMIKLMNSDVKSQRYILISENMLYRDFFNLAHKAMRKPLPFIKTTKFMSGLAWRIEKITSSLLGYEPLITKETAQAAHRVNAYSNQKIQKVFPYTFIPVAESLTHTCNLYLKDKNG